MDAALLLAALASRAGDRVDLLAYDRRVRAQGRRRARRTDLLPALVAAMAPLEPDAGRGGLAGLVAAVLRAAWRSGRWWCC